MAGGGRRAAGGGAGAASRAGPGPGPGMAKRRLVAGRRVPVGGRLRAGLRQAWVWSALESGPSAGGTKISCWSGGGGAGAVCF